MQYYDLKFVFNKRNIKTKLLLRMLHTRKEVPVSLAIIITLRKQFLPLLLMKKVHVCVLPFRTARKIN